MDGKDNPETDDTEGNMPYRFVKPDADHEDESAVGQRRQVADDGTEDDAGGHAPIHKRLDAEGTEDDAEGHQRA